MNYRLTATYRPTGYASSVIVPTEHDANVALVEAIEVFPLKVLRLTDWRIEATDQPVSKGFGF